MNLVYFVKPGDDNDELRYSLRSVEAMWPSHGTIWVVGHKPTWLTGVRHIPGNHHNTKQLNVWCNVRIAAEHPDIPARFVMMNDDFFAVKPITRIPTHYRGTLYDHITMVQRDTWWKRSLMATRDYLHDQGITDPLSYELHRPMPIVKTKLATALTAAAQWSPTNPPQWRTLYGNHSHPRATPAPDVKLYTGDPLDLEGIGDWVSTTDRSFTRNTFRNTISSLYPKPSRYEQACPCGHD